MALIAPERLLMREHIASACRKHVQFSGLDESTANAIVRRIERGCFEHTIDTCKQCGIDRLFTNPGFCGRYSVQCYKTIANVDPDSSVGGTELVQELVRGTIKPENVVNLTNFELCPRASKKERDVIELRQKQKYEKKVCTMYTCDKCKQANTDAVEYQGRSADEPSTWSITCNNCGNRWTR